MPVCKECSESVSFFDTIHGVCRKCRNETGSRPPVSNQKDQYEIASSEDLTKIAITTELVACDANVERLGLVSGTCVFGQHLGKDIMAAWRDTFGGRARALENAYNDAREEAIKDLSRHAHRLGADGVVAISIQHQELTGGGRSMAMVTAIGTAIRTR